MNTRTRVVVAALIAIACHPAAPPATPPARPAAVAEPPDWSAVEAAIGRPGSTQPGGVYRFAFPRGDLHVTAGGVRVLPALALGSWIAFLPHGDRTIAMGDMVLTEAELTPVLRRLQQGGIEQTAVHHHIIRESPRILYVHIHAEGDPVRIATAVRGAVALTGTPAPAPSQPSAARFPLDTGQIARLLGATGRVNGGVYQVGIPRAETIRLHGVEIPASMGLGTAINFQPTGDGRAAITGDFVLLGSEVNPVIEALLENDIEVTSLHSHLLAEEPRLFFMHFWAEADAVTLARGLAAALGRTNAGRTTGR